MKNIFSGKPTSPFAPEKKAKNICNTKKYTKNTSNTPKYSPLFRTLAAGTYQPALSLANLALLEPWTEFLAASNTPKSELRPTL